MFVLPGTSGANQRRACAGRVDRLSWWRDRAGAMVRLHGELLALAARGVAGLPAGSGGPALDRWYPRVALVVEGKARAAMEAGPVKLIGLDFALFLEKQIVDGLELFGPKYLANPGQLKTLCGVADRLVPPIEAMLKENPDKAKEAEFKKLQKQIKDAEKLT